MAVKLIMDAFILKAGGLYGAWGPEPFQDSSRHSSRLLSERSLPYLPGGNNPLSSGGPRRTWSGTIPGGSVDGTEYPLVYSPGSISEMSSDTKLDDGGDDSTTPQKRKKRGRGSDDGEDNPRKSRNPRKTAVACNFCRGARSAYN